MSTYQPGIPTGNLNLDVDYKNIQGNFSQANIVFGSDHVPFDDVTAQKGYHEDVHFNPLSTVVTDAPNNYDPSTQYPQGIPATVAGIAQVFSAQVTDGLGTDTGLFFLSGSGTKIALTRNLNPKINTNGHTFLPGGALLQWGRVTASSGTGTVAFDTSNVTFSNSCFNVFTQSIYNPAFVPTNTLTISIESITKSAFKWRFITSKGSYTGFFWVAIGY